MKSPNAQSALPKSPTKSMKRAVTMNEDGEKRVVNLDEAKSPIKKVKSKPPLSGIIRSPNQRYIERRNKNKEKVADIFGDYFGFGSIPEGALKKDGNPINVKNEKNAFIAYLDEEAKKYDVAEMHVDLEKKMEVILGGIKKEQKAIMNDEERQLRNLDRLEYMAQYLKEDYSSTQESLAEAERIKNKSKEEMARFDQRNKKELTDLEQ